MSGKVSLEKFVDQEPRSSPAYAQGKAVAQIIKNQFFVGAVGDVARVCLLPLSRLLPVFDEFGGQSESRIDWTQLLGVAAREIVVNGDDMHGATHQGRGDRRQERGDGLAFACFHFRQRAAHHRGAADQLDREMP